MSSSDPERHSAGADFTLQVKVVLKDILTFIKDRSERYEGEELVDFGQDVGLAGQRRILVPDLNHVFPVAHADADAHDLVVWKEGRARGDGECTRTHACTQLGCGHAGLT